MYISGSITERSSNNGSSKRKRVNSQGRSSNNLNDISKRVAHLELQIALLANKYTVSGKQYAAAFSGAKSELQTLKNAKMDAFLASFVPPKKRGVATNANNQQNRGMSYGGLGARPGSPGCGPAYRAMGRYVPC